MLYKFFSDELNIDNSDSIDFQRVHSIGRKKLGQPRPIIARFLRFPDREMVFKSVRELGEETDLKIYPDSPDEICEGRRKQWPRMKKAREEGKTAYFSKAQPDRLYIDGDLVVFDFWLSGILLFLSLSFVVFGGEESRQKFTYQLLRPLFPRQHVGYYLYAAFLCLLFNVVV